MSFFGSLSTYLRPPDLRPIRQIDAEILDELEFHIEMRAQDNQRAGMPPDEAQADAERRFGDVRQIHEACRQARIGDRIMLQRIHAAVTLLLFAAVVYMGVELYSRQRANEDAMAAMREKIQQLSESPPVAAPAADLLQETFEAAPPVVVSTVPATGDEDVDPSLGEIRVTYSKPMMDGSWSWSQDLSKPFPRATGEPRYLPDGKTCVLPVKLEPGTSYVIWLNSQKFGNFKDRDGLSAVPHCLHFQTRK